MYKNYYVLQKLSRYPMVVHAFSTRKAGDMGFSRQIEANRAHRRRFVEQFAIPAHRVVKMEQPHGTSIAVVGEQDTQPVDGDEFVSGVDGLLTNQERVYLLAVSADCMPIIFFDPQTGSVGLAHAGWRGVVGKLPALMVAAMMREFGSNPQHILVGIGPSLSSESMVMKEDAIQEQLPEWRNFIINGEDGKTRIDMIGFAVQQLVDIGVPEANIEDGGVCTAQSPEDFYSASSRGETERMATIVGLRSLVV